MEDELRSFDPLQAGWDPELEAVRESLSEPELNAVAVRWILAEIVQGAAALSEEEAPARVIKLLLLVSTHPIAWDLAGRVGRRNGCLRMILGAVDAWRTDTKKWASLASALGSLEGIKFLAPDTVRKAGDNLQKNMTVYPLAAALVQRVRDACLE